MAVKVGADPARGIDRAPERGLQYRVAFGWHFDRREDRVVLGPVADDHVVLARRDYLLERTGMRVVGVFDGDLTRVRSPIGILGPFLAGERHLGRHRLSVRIGNKRNDVTWRRELNAKSLVFSAR